MYDFCVVGGGIVGLATARELASANPGCSILLIEKERALAIHQTGHNSGVIHSGIYYRPGSLKAELCKRGAEATKQFCRDNNIPFETRGKLIVATDERQLHRMKALAETAGKNEIEIEVIDAKAIAQREPSITGVGAILVPSAGIVSYVAICEAMAAMLRTAGCEIVLGSTVEAIREESNDVIIETSSETYRARQLIVCGGLQADRMAKLAGLQIDYQIVPFRGEYYDVTPAKRDLVHHLIYPVPDPELPFLGIHLTPMIDGNLTIGPNAVLGFSREGYAKFSANPRDILAFSSFPGFWKVLAKNWRSALSEARNSLFKAAYLAECQKYCPSIALDDLIPRTAGIRAQAVSRDGTLVQDFLFLRTERMLHVCNAPSPAATSAIPIAQKIVAQLGSNSLAMKGLEHAH
jgi:L-2-hydroxyglutarate oxidase